MLISVYLHKNIVDTLRCYGELSEVVNRILDASEEGIFDLTDMPKCRSREGALRFEVNVTNETYLCLLNNYPVNSPRISLRRILYWFVEEEMYDILQWEAVNEYQDRDKERILKRIGGIESSVQRLSKCVNGKERTYLSTVLNTLMELKEYVTNGR